MFIHFGKYRNECLKDILEKDQKYLEWLITQPWYKIKFKDLCNQTVHLLNEKNKEPIIVDENTTTIYTDGACSHNGTSKAKMGIGVYFSKKNKISIPNSIKNNTTATKKRRLVSIAIIVIFKYIP